MKPAHIFPMKHVFMALAAIALTGCASSGAKNSTDPWESFNRGVYKFNDTVDRSITKPVAQGYTAVVPVPARTMVSNFFSNLDDLVVTANDLLQFKFRQAFSDGGRMLVNTTVGVFGLVDVATQAGYEKHKEDFGQTLGYWGIASGPYLVLPFLGPSTVRDGIGIYADSQASVSWHVNHIRTRNQLYLANAINRRALLLDQEKVLDEAALDRYSFIRDTYLQYRQNLIYDGNPPHEKYEEEENGFEYQPAPHAHASHDTTAPESDSSQPQAISVTAPATGDINPITHKVWVSYPQ